MANGNENSTPALNESTDDETDSEDEDLPPGIAAIDDQGDSEMCVRFAIAKAIKNHLYFQENPIDIEQSHIMICLVQAKRCRCAVNPSVYDRITLFLQDKENRKPKPATCQRCEVNCGECADPNESGIPNKSWWRAEVKVEDVYDLLKNDDDEYEDGSEYVLGFWPKKLENGTQKGESADDVPHCVYVMKRYDIVKKKQPKKLFFLRIFQKGRKSRKSSRIRKGL